MTETGSVQVCAIDEIGEGRGIIWNSYLMQNRRCLAGEAGLPIIEERPSLGELILA